MRGINKTIFIGRVGQDPETRYLPSGTTITNIIVIIQRTAGKRYLSGATRRVRRGWRFAMTEQDALQKWCPFVRVPAYKTSTNRTATGGEGKA